MFIKLCNRFLDFDAVDIQNVDLTIFTFVLDFRTLMLSIFKMLI